jgi:protein TonB
MVLSERPTPLTGMKRNALMAAGVVAVHVAALWAMQNGLLRRAVETVVPAEIVVEFITPPAPKVVPTPPAPPKPVPLKQTVSKAPTPVKNTAPLPLPLAIADPTPAPHAPTGLVAAATPAPQVVAPVAEAAPARVQLPSSDADYLQNPKPAYPPMSKRLGEQGKVVLRVFIGVDGTAQQADIKQSSGFDRLDQAALNTVLRWRYVPGKRAGVAEAMWFNVPINFVLN